MKAKGNYTTTSNPGVSTPYRATDGKFGEKVNNARKKVDPTVTSPELVRDANGLQNELSRTSGKIKQVVDDWVNSTNIATAYKDDASNKPAKDAIAAIEGYTNENSEAHSTIGSHKTPNKPSPQSRSLVLWI